MADQGIDFYKSNRIMSPTKIPWGHTVNEGYMDDGIVREAIAKFYGSSYDTSMQVIQEYINIRDKLKNSRIRLTPGSIEELRAVVQLVLVVISAKLEEGENERFLRISEIDDWVQPIVRYIVEYKEEVCQEPDYTLDPLQGWVGDLSDRGFLPQAASETMPPISIFDWLSEYRNKETNGN
jgi:hypothetical protein